MEIVIIGSGNVAAVLGRKFVAAGHKIIQVFGRNASAASELAYEWDTASTNYSSLINNEADVYIIAVSDTSIAEVVSDLHLPRKVVAHTAASVEKDILKSVTEDYGVFYPLQSLRKDQKIIPPMPIYTDAATEKAKSVLEKLARSISSSVVKTVPFDKRAKMHVAAVIANNFTNHIFSLVEDYCKKEEIDFLDLLPLINNSIERMYSSSPSQMQTGPAFRNDEDTIAKHLEMLKNYPKLLNVYNCISNSIMNK
ncbi:MAG: DUF2520 domain-containing protein [Sphingobacteriales bacterium]|jgi:predicted short-subunit dehydrogenase-like oxidoreductase (DUF2520 family)|nr:DUF2520 domain-containing protein [Sphingobacteriales bacterium]